MSKRILIVDDEPMVLTVLKRVLETTLDAEIVTALNANEALRHLEAESFDVIVSDIKMPGVDGVELLSVVQERYPHIARMVFSAWSGGEVALKTAGTAHQFFTKPGDISIISKRIERVLKLRDMLPKEGLEWVISAVNTLPSLPKTYRELEKEIESPTASVESISRIIESDIAMSAKILQLLNSSFFHPSMKKTKASEAVPVIGLQVLKSLVLAMHVFTEWHDGITPGFDPERILAHSVTVAGVSRQLAINAGMTHSQTEEIYSAGLFHDIGKLLLAANAPDSCQCIEDVRVQKGLTRLEAEENVLGATHAEAGAYLMALWGFDEPIITVCAFHHHPERSSDKGFTPLTAVHVANALTHEILDGGEWGQSVVNSEYLEREGVSGEIAKWREITEKFLKTQQLQT
jgi:HD-like signal output (HDOD) protein